MRRVHPQLRPPLSLGEQVRGRPEHQTVLLLRQYKIIELGVTPLYLLYFIVMLVAGLIMTKVY